MFAWLRADVLAYGEARGPGDVSDYVEHLSPFGDARTDDQIMMAIDHAGEHIAVASRHGVRLFSVPRRASQSLLHQEIRMLAFSPSGLLYARARPHDLRVRPGVTVDNRPGVGASSRCLATCR